MTDPSSPKTVLMAQCSNCVSWTRTPDLGHPTASNVGFCGRGLAPDAGQLLCQRYEATPAFKQLIISTMLKEQGPMAMPVKLVGGKRSAKEFTKKKPGRGR